MGILTTLITFIIPLIYIFGGILFVYRAPSYNCRGPAYRTKKTVLNPGIWRYANFDFGIVCIFVGIYTIILTGLTDAIFWRFSLRPLEVALFCVVVVLIQAALVFLPYYNTEQHLKDYFDEEGNALFTDEDRPKFLKRRNEEEWEQWKTWSDEDKEKDDDWDDWETWLRKRDIELDREREQQKSEEISLSPDVLKNLDGDPSEEILSQENLEKEIFEEIRSLSKEKSDSPEESNAAENNPPEEEAIPDIEEYLAEYLIDTDDDTETTAEEDMPDSPETGDAPAAEQETPEALSEPDEETGLPDRTETSTPDEDKPVEEEDSPDDTADSDTEAEETDDSENQKTDAEDQELQDAPENQDNLQSQDDLQNQEVSGSSLSDKLSGWIGTIRQKIRKKEE